MSEPTEKQTPLPCPWVKFPFNEEDPACVKCGDSLSLNPLSEWGDPNYVMCGSCACDTVNELWNTRAPSAELAAVEAQAAAMRECLIGLLKLRKNCEGDIGWRGKPTAIVDYIRVKHILAIEKALSTNAGAELLDRLSKAEALAIQMTAEREHNAMEALAMRAERDRLRQERDSALALVERLKGALEIVLGSAVPHVVENPAMFQAWKEGRAALVAAARAKGSDK